MTAKEFNQKAKSILSKYNSLAKGSRYQYEMQTICGKWMFSLEYTPRIKVASCHSRFENFNKDAFAKHISEFDRPNTFNYKWNKYSQHPEDILSFIDETVNNFEWLNEQQN